jgi:hypothetical protein
MEENKPITHQVDDAVLIVEAESIKLRQKSAFAVQHLIAAARLSRQCGEIQSQNIGATLGSFFDEQIACVSATVMLCVAALESNINEYLSEPNQIFAELPEHARRHVAELCAELSILEKYQRVLSLKGCAQFDRGARPYQDIDALIAVRNELVHFHPEWHDEQERHRKLGDKLRYKFEMSPFIAEGTGVDFPQRFVSHGCTRWAVEYTLQFMEEFDQKAGLPSKFRKFHGRLNA